MSRPNGAVCGRLRQRTVHWQALASAIRNDNEITQFLMPSMVLTLKNSSMSPTRPHRSSIASRQKRRHTEGSTHREARTTCSRDDADTTDEMSPFGPSRRCPSAGLSKNGGGDTKGLASGRPAPYQEGQTPGPSAPLAIPLFAYKRQSCPRPVTTR